MKQTNNHQTEKMNENLADIWEAIVNAFNDETIVYIGEDAIEKGMMLKMILGTVIGVPGAALLATNYKEIMDAIKKKFKDIGSAIRHILGMKGGEDVLESLNLDSDSGRHIKMFESFEAEE